MPETNKEKSIFTELSKTTSKKSSIEKKEKYLDNYYSKDFVKNFFA